MLSADNQPVDSRFGEAIWITDLITPDNPDVILKYQEITRNLSDPEDIIIALWQYVANMPYKPTVAARLTAGGRTFKQKDTWLFPAETIMIDLGNCATRSFLLASLVKNYLRNQSNVFCVIGELSIDGVGAHAWVQVNNGSRSFILESTQPRISHALVPLHLAPAYIPMVYFDDKNVYTANNEVDVAQALTATFGLCAVDFLGTYLCERCLVL